MKVSVSYLSSKFDKKTTLKKIVESKADYLHVDLMDGKYVENKNFTINEVLNDLKSIYIPLDIHLMVNNPDKYLEKLGTLNTEFITFHPSTSKDPNKTIEKIKSLGINVGIAINPNEDIHMIDEYLDKIDLVLIMSVNPGKGGQEFIPEVLDKLDYLKDQNVIVSIDGGINNETIKLIADKKIDIIVSGSYVCSSNDFDEKIACLKKIIAI